MMRRITGWLKTTSLWINVAVIFTVLFPALIVLNLVGIGPLNNKVLALGNLLLCLILIGRYGVLKQSQRCLVLIFLIWMTGTSLYAGADIIKALGCLLNRMWYVCLMVYLVAIILDEKARRKWITTMLGFTVAFVIPVFGRILIKGTMQLVNSSYESNMLWGQIMNGRLNGMSNSNILGDAAVAILIASIWLVSIAASDSKITVIVFLPELIKMRKAIADKVFIVIGILGGIMSMLILGLSKSRGAIISSILSVGLLFLILEKSENGNKKLMIRDFLAAIVAMAVFTVILFVVPKVYNSGVLNYVENRYGVQSEHYAYVHEKLISETDEANLTSLTDRPLIWRAVIKMLDEEPKWWITGITAAKSSEIYVRDIYYQRPDKIALHAHNGYVESLYLYGIPGALLLGIILIGWIRCGIKIFFNRKEKNCIRQLTVFAVASLMVGFVEIYPFPFNQLYLLSYFTFLAAGICEKRSEVKIEDI